MPESRYGSFSPCLAKSCEEAFPQILVDAIRKFRRVSTGVRRTSLVMREPKKTPITSSEEIMRLFPRQLWVHAPKQEYSSETKREYPEAE